MNKTTKINILAYVSEPDKTYNYYGDIVTYESKRYFVSLAEERVEFLGIVDELKNQKSLEKMATSDILAELSEYDAKTGDSIIDKLGGK